jgi:hypothetical protein
VRGSAQRVTCGGPEIEYGGMRHDLYTWYKTREVIVRGCNGKREKVALRTRLSQIATSFGCHLKRTWKSWFSLIWEKRKERIASDSALGTSAMRRVKPGFHAEEMWERGEGGRRVCVDGRSNGGWDS